MNGTPTFWQDLYFGFVYLAVLVLYVIAECWLQLLLIYLIYRFIKMAVCYYKRQNNNL